MIDKVVGSVEEAIAGIRDGASVAIGGFGAPGFPGNLIEALANTDVTDLHIIANGVMGDGIAKLAAEHRVRKLSAGFPFGGAWNAEVFSGKVEVEVLPQGTLSERLRAGGAGIAAFYTPTSIGTPIADGTFPKRFDENGEPIEFVDPKEVREFDGRSYVLEHGIRPDFGFIKCTKADRLGNLYFRLTSRNFNPSIAMASRCTIVQAHEIVEPGEIDPNDVHVPGAFVDIVVHVPRESEIVNAPRPRSTRPEPTPEEVAERVGWSREEIAENIGTDIGEGWYINLGVGMPLLAAKYVAEDKNVTMHMENGILGAGGPPEVPDPDLTDAGAQPVTLRTGAAIFDSALSFAIVRGGYLDLTVLGGLQVSERGDLANWYMPKGQTGVGGAMDLVQGAKAVWVAMEHVDRNGNPKILHECTFALTGPGVVKRIYTDLAVFSLESGSLELIRLAPGVTVEYVRERTEPEFTVAPGVGGWGVAVAGSIPLDDVVAIDVHTHVTSSVDHVGEREIAKEFEEYFGTEMASPTVPDLAAYYRERKMAAVIFNVDSTSATGRAPSVSNDEIGRLSADYRDVLIPFCSVDPHSGRAGAAEVRRVVAEYDIKGFKFHPGSQAFYPNDPAFYPILEAIEQTGRVALFHSGHTGVGARQRGGGGIRLKFCNPMFLDDVAVDFPDLSLILAHPAFPWQDEALSVALHKPQVYLDLSGWSPKYFPPNLIQYTNTLLRDKVLFGSDYPAITPDRWVADFAAIAIRDEVRPLVMKENAARLFGLSGD